VNIWSIRRIYGILKRAYTENPYIRAIMHFCNIKPIYSPKNAMCAYIHYFSGVGVVYLGESLCVMDINDS